MWFMTGHTREGQDSNQDNRTTVKIGGVDVLAPSSWDDLLSRVFTERGEVIPGFAVAINPEKVIAIHRGLLAEELLKNVTLAYPDGIGVVLAMRLRGARGAKRFPGVELWQQAMARAAEVGAKVFLLGGPEDGLPELTLRLREEFPNLRIVGMQHGYFLREDWEDISRKIATAEPDIIAVGMGSPLQEQFIAYCRADRDPGFYLGVGGTFDVFTGKVKRAPPVFRSLGLEWFFRLLSQPRRLGRHVNLLRFIGLLLARRI